MFRDNQFNIYQELTVHVCGKLLFISRSTATYTPLHKLIRVCNALLITRVVSTVISGILLARFHTIECIPTICSFLLTSLTVEARNKRESTTFSEL